MTTGNVLAAMGRLDGKKCPDCSSELNLTTEGHPDRGTMAAYYMTNSVGACLVAECSARCGLKAKIPINPNLPLVFGTAAVRWMRAACHAVVDATAKTRSIKANTLKRILFYKFKDRLGHEYLADQNPIDQTIHFGRIDDHDLLLEILETACGWVGGFKNVSRSALAPFTATMPHVPEIFDRLFQVKMDSAIDDSCLMSPLLGRLSPASAYELSVRMADAKYRALDRTVMVDSPTDVYSMLWALQDGIDPDDRAMVFCSSVDKFTTLTDSLRRRSSWLLKREAADRLIKKKLLVEHRKNADGTLYKIEKNTLNSCSDLLDLGFADYVRAKFELPTITDLEPAKEILITKDDMTTAKPKARKLKAPKTDDPTAKLVEVQVQPKDEAAGLEFEPPAKFEMYNCPAQNGRWVLTFVPANPMNGDLFKGFEGIVSTVTGEYAKEVLFNERKLRFASGDVKGAELLAGAKVYSVVVDSQDLAERITKAMEILYAI